MSQHRIYPSRPPSWLAINNISHARGTVSHVLCGLPVARDAITGKGLTRCPACVVMWHQRAKATAERKQRSCICGWTGKGKPHDPALCRRERKVWQNPPPPADVEGTHGYNGRNYAGRGTGYGEPFRVPNSEMRRAPVGIY